MNKSTTTTLISVNSKQHNETLAGGLWNFFKTNQEVDFDFQWGGRLIRAHCLVLHVFLSPEKLLALCTTGSGIDSDANPTDGQLLDSLLEFLYKGSITVDEELLERLMYVAKELDFGLLVDAIELAKKGNPEETTTTQSRRRRKGIPVKLPNVSDDETPSANKQKVRSPVVPRRKPGRPSGSGLRYVPTIKQDPPADTELDEEDAFYRASTDDEAGSSDPEKESEKSSAEEEEEDDDEEGSDFEKELKKGKSDDTPSKRSRGRPRKNDQVNSKPRPKAINKKSKGDADASLSRTIRKREWLARQPVLSCPHCPYETHFKRSFRVHESRHDPTIAVYRCSICSVVFLNDESLEKHKLTQHADIASSYSCTLCNYQTGKEKNLKSHMVVAHKVTIKGKPLRNTLQCDQCDFTCSYASHMTNHAMRHQSDRPFKCELCSYATIRKYDLDKHHKITHLNIRTYMCETCGHKSANKVALAGHMRTHTGERPFICTYPECGKAYASKDKLKFHLNRHVTQDKPYVCQACAFSCYRRDNLQMHMKRIHKTTLNNESIAGMSFQ